MVDVDRALGIRWRNWGMLAAFSWLLMFVGSWVAFPLIMGDWLVGYPMLWAAFALFVAAHGVPGAAAVLSPALKDRLREMPEAAALALLAVSVCIAFFCMIAICWLLGEGPGMAAAAMLIGVLAFWSTYGMAFPLLIPLACAVLTWTNVRRRGAMTRRMFSVLSGVATVGWVAVGCVGLILGNA